MANTDGKGLGKAETFILRNSQIAEAAERMAKAPRGSGDERVAYSRLLVEESKSFGDYITKKVGARLKDAS